MPSRGGAGPVALGWRSRWLVELQQPVELLLVLRDVVLRPTLLTRLTSLSVGSDWSVGFGLTIDFLPVQLRGSRRNFQAQHISFPLLTLWPTALS